LIWNIRRLIVLTFSTKNQVLEKFLISGKNPANNFETGPEPEPDFEAGNPAGTGFSRISGRFLIVIKGRAAKVRGN